jgi:AcrR family transcriptional regulator
MAKSKFKTLTSQFCGSGFLYLYLMNFGARKQFTKTARCLLLHKLREMCTFGNWKRKRAACKKSENRVKSSCEWIAKNRKRQGEQSMKNAEGSAKTLQTRRMLASQMMDLLESQSFKKITINDICQRAMISRSAFYLHFEDKYDLLRYCLECELGSLEQKMYTIEIDEFLELALQEFLEKKKFYYNTLGAEPDQELTDLFQALFSRFFAARLEAMQAQGKALPGPVSIVSAFYAGGFVCTMVQWIKNGADISVEEMAQCQKQLLAPLAGEQAEA